MDENIANVNITNHQSNIQIVKDVTSNLIGSFTGGMLSFAMGLMLLSATHSAISFGLSMIITPVMGLLFMIPIGNIVDTYHHKNIIVISMIIRIITMITFYFTINMFVGEYKLIPVAIFLSIDSISTNFNSTSVDASVHELVNDNSIEKLTSLVQSSMAISSIFAPMLGAALYSLFGFNLFIIIEIASSIVSLLITISMHFHYFSDLSSLDDMNKNSSMDKFKSGFEYVRNFKFIRYIIIIGVVFNFFFTAITIGMPYIIQVQLHMGKLPISVLDSSASLGMLIGGLIINIIPKSTGYNIKLIFPIIGTILSLILFGFIFSIHSIIGISIVGGIIMFVLMSLITIMNISVQVMLQKNVQNKMLGRVMSMTITFNMSIMPLGTLFYSFIFNKVSNGGLIFIVSGLLLLVYILCLMPSILRMLKSSRIKI
ncbi:MFS transporter [Apilactobacillus timberlakei]|uniref:MFS transporter n=1 Tax=Apilactobacillus timberlakei TaxID=2008380 RepID=A0ABY2YVS9_9LACO|nr:MFS transporter [Apilactobacillus timberlakei]TPR12346.1 MFS transporter [Apilactobacillus timberlakei]TPR12855.1 MFS transporter [Apilactobacillus timberlakei]TPR14405.1 MFS transporter [Apilactobacillus timberlakei]